MNETIREILARITELEDELHDAIHQQQVHFNYRIAGSRVSFERHIREAHRRLKVGLLPWLRQSELRNVITAPVIYSVFFPLIFLDIGITIYQHLCFPLYRVGLVKRRRYVVIDRHQLRYLNSIERLNCAYCGYANGVLAYAREVAARTEQYWCPIKHARKIFDQHRRYADFADFGDAESWQASVAKLRAELARERTETQPHGDPEM